MPEAAGPPAVAAAPRPHGWWARAKEALLPSGTFAQSEDPEGDLGLGRCLVALFYTLIFGMFLYTVYHVFKTGKVGVTRETFKHDTFETPSVAFCPFFCQHYRGDAEGHRQDGDRGDVHPFGRPHAQAEYQNVQV